MRHFDNIIDKLTSESAPSNGHGTKKRNGAEIVLALTPEQRRSYLSNAHTALREGMTVFMTKETVDQFSKLLGVEVSKGFMRRLLAQIGSGKLKIVKAGATTQPTIHTKPLKRDLQMVVPSGNLELGEAPLTLRQAARLLNCKSASLYYRCSMGRINYTKIGSRYLIPVQEINRLRVVGVY